MNVRLEKLARLRAKGIEPYPHRYERSHTVRESIAAFESREQVDGKDARTDEVALAGRVVAVRQRSGRQLVLSCRWARLAGLLSVPYSLVGAAFCRGAQLACWLLSGLLLRLPNALQRKRRFLGALIWIETLHWTLRPAWRRLPDALLGALARHAQRRHPETLARLDETPSAP